jgi:hypothetical protein
MLNAIYVFPVGLAGAVIAELSETSKDALVPPALASSTARPVVGVVARPTAANVLVPAIVATAGASDGNAANVDVPAIVATELDIMGTSENSWIRALPKIRAIYIFSPELPKNRPPGLLSPVANDTLS